MSGPVILQEMKYGEFALALTGVRSLAEYGIMDRMRRSGWAAMKVHKFDEHGGLIGTLGSQSSGAVLNFLGS